MRGYTLIEVTVTIALFLIALLGVAQLYIVYERVISLQSASIDVALDASAIADAVRTNGEQADHVVASHTFPAATLSTGASTVIFELPSIDSTGTAIPSTFDYVGIYATGTSAYRLTDAAAGSARVSGTKLLTTVLQALSFTYDSATISAITNVSAEATTSSTVRGQLRQVHVREHVYLKNL